MRVTALSAIKHDGVDYLDGQTFEINDVAGQLLVNDRVATLEGQLKVAEAAQTTGDQVVDAEKLAPQPAQPGQPTPVTVRKA
jgi:hypothetical protein